MTNKQKAASALSPLLYIRLCWFMPMLTLSDEELSILDFTLIKRKWCMYTQIELECAYSVHCTHIPTCSGCCN